MPDDEKPIVRLSTPNTPNDLALFAEQWREVVTGGEWLRLDGGTLDIGMSRVNPDPQPMDCGCVPEWPEVTPLMREVAQLIDDLHEIPGCEVGGPLHIVTDDPNYEDHHLNYCAESVFQLPGSDGHGGGWWREYQDAYHSDLMERVCMAILWGMSSMSYNERAIVGGYWPLPEDGSRDPNPAWTLGPDQEDWLYEVECGNVADPVQPDWCCDGHWAQTINPQPMPCPSTYQTCPPVQEVEVTAVSSCVDKPSANPFGLWLPGEP